MGQSTPGGLKLLSAGSAAVGTPGLPRVEACARGKGRGPRRRLFEDGLGGLIRHRYPPTIPLVRNLPRSKKRERPNMPRIAPTRPSAPAGPVSVTPPAKPENRTGKSAPVGATMRCLYKHHAGEGLEFDEIGRASCRERV